MTADSKHDAGTFLSPVSERIWRSKYQYRDARHVHDRSIVDTWRRVADAAASVERDPARWAPRFLELLTDFKFLPGGRILAGAGTDRHVTLFNCFVMGPIEDSVEGIFDAVKEGALTMQQGGGVGYDFSTLRPAGSWARTVGNIASGPVSFMRIWDSMCATMLSTGARRGAMMAVLRCDHPDIETFITAKSDPRELRNFNLSVLVTDEFVKAVREDAGWQLVFPASALEDDEAGQASVERTWSNASKAVPCRVIKTVSARDLWRRLMRATYEYAEPGVLFIDRINSENPLSYRETISATNPCGEVPLPPYGACDLGSLNLTRFVCNPFTQDAFVDMAALNQAAQLAVRFLDNVIDLSRYPLRAQRDQAACTRRVGLGITGLADALIMLDLRYDSDRARAQAATIMGSICRSAYRSSIGLAREKGTFPALDTGAHMKASFIRRLPPEISEGIAHDGLRNSHLLAIAPTGSISLLANNVSSGIEPVFSAEYQRRVLDADGNYEQCKVADFAWSAWRRLNTGTRTPDSFVTAREIKPLDHLRMQAAVQPHVDQAISKTINVPADIEFDDFIEIYLQAHDLGLKGCTTFRENRVTGSVLSADHPSVHCCGLEREPD